MTAEKREQIALAILPTVIEVMANAPLGASSSPGAIARVAVDYADALLSELAKKSKTPP